MIIISHDRHFLNQVCTHIADLDYQQLKIYPGNYDDFMLASVQARERVEASNAKAKERISDLQEFRASLLGERVESAPGDVPQAPAGEDQDRGSEALLASESVHPLRAGEEAVPLGVHGREPVVPVSRRRGEDPRQCQLQRRGRRATRHHRRERYRQVHPHASAGGRAQTRTRARSSGSRTRSPATCRRTLPPNSARTGGPVHLDVRVDRQGG